MKIQRDSISRQYIKYLQSHIGAVKESYNWICENLPELIDDTISDTLYENIRIHDMSKYGIEEFTPYAKYFYGGEKTDEVNRDFDYAWLHHQHNNPHHWQYWVLKEDEGKLKALDMPDEYILEMICDWWAFSWVKGNLYEIFSWYENNKHKQILSDRTKEKVELILSKIKEKIEQ